MAILSRISLELLGIGWLLAMLSWPLYLILNAIERLIKEVISLKKDEDVLP